MQSTTIFLTVITGDSVTERQLDLRVAAGGCTLIVATGIRYRTVGR
jgi:hypothetical protein